MPENRVHVTLIEYQNSNYRNFRAVRAGLVYTDLQYVGPSRTPCQMKALVRQDLVWRTPDGMVEDDYDEYDEYDECDECDEDEYDEDDYDEDD